MNQNNKHNKTTSEKPISLHPLSFDEALKALVNTSPKEDKKNEKPSEKS